MVRKPRALLFIGIFLLALSRAVSAEVMFEGYSIVRVGSKAVGYAIQRYEFDGKKKKFIATSFLKTNEDGGNITESLKAEANDKFQPLSFQYVTKTGGGAKMIDSKFVKDNMVATVTNGQTKNTLKIPVKKGVFLSTFLGYLMLQNGYKVDKKFTYSAIAEEDGQAYTGEAAIEAEAEVKGHKVFKIKNTFKGSEFISQVTPKGEILATNSSLQGVSTELVASASEATKGFTVPSDTLKILFGTVPTGKVNVLAGKVANVIPVTAPAGTASSTSPTGHSPPKSAPPPEKSNEPSLPAEPSGK